MGLCYSVPNDQIYLVERCGKFSHLAHPGFLCVPVPCVWKVAGKVSTRITQLDVVVETKTRDNVFVQLTVSVQYMVQVNKIFEAHYSLASPEEQIRSYVFDVVRATVPQQSLDEVFESKDEIATAVKEQLKTTMETFGFLIVQALVTDVIPDARVKSAMNEINASKRNRMAAQEKAEADKILVVKQAEAEAEAKYLQGEGIARQRRAIIDGLRESVTDFSHEIKGVDPKDVLDLVLITQYFDTMKDLGMTSGQQTVFVPHNPGSLASLAEEIKNGLLIAQQAVDCELLAENFRTQILVNAQTHISASYCPQVSNKEKGLFNWFKRYQLNWKVKHEASLINSQPIKTPSYFPIKEITTWTSRWTIQGRIIERQPLNEFKRIDGPPRKVGSVTIMDKNGDSIRATFWGEAAEKWIPILQEGKIFTFSGGRVQIANKRFNTSSHQYELVFEKDSKIEESAVNAQTSCDVADIPHYRRSNFTNLYEIKNTPKESPFIVDLCVVLKWLAPNHETFTRNDGIETYRRNASVIDDTGYELSITLWGDQALADHPIAKAYHQQDQDLVVLVMQNIQIREFRGRQGSTLRTSHILINPKDIPEAIELSTWYKREGKSISYQSLSESVPTQMTGVGSSSMSSLAKAFQVLQSMAVTNSQEQGEFHTVVAEPMKFLYATRTGEITLIFRGCPRCNRKCSGDEDGGYRCDVCENVIEKPIDRFSFGISLVDASGSRFLARIFNDQAKIILQRSADEISKHIPRGCTLNEVPNQIKQLLEFDALWNRFRFRLRLKKDFFGGEERKNASIVAVERLNYSSDARRMLAEIATILPEAVNLQGSKKRAAPEEPVIREVTDHLYNEKEEDRGKRAKKNTDEETKNKGDEESVDNVHE